VSGKTAIVWSCAHASPEFSNERFDWLGELIYDIKPDYVVDLGDGADMASLSSYDTKYPKMIVNQSYEKDIDSYNESQDRLRHKFKINKRKMPKWYGLCGNHDFRVQKAIQLDPRLEGQRYGVSFKHLQTDYWFDEYTEYSNSAPGIVVYDGVSYAHYISSGNYGAAMSGLHHASKLVAKRHCSTTVGHSHKRDFYPADDAYPKAIMGLVAGCYKGGDDHWSGQSAKGWWKGCVVKRGIEGGTYEPEFISMARLKETYGKHT
jgi:hypothetical protein